VKNALIIYSSTTGNTAKVANAIKEGLVDSGFQVSIIKPSEARDVDFFNFDLVCIGSPSIQWHPAKLIDDFLKEKFAVYRKEGRIKVSAPKVADKRALIFITYSGPHTGIDEALPAGKYIRQFFEHLGFEVVDEWYVLSEFVFSLENSTNGRMGDIRGKPTIDDLKKIRMDVVKVAASF
jgi:flavorubredoxin